MVSEAGLQDAPPARERSRHARGLRNNSKNSTYQEKQRLWSITETASSSVTPGMNPFQQGMQRAHNTKGLSNLAKVLQGLLNMKLQINLQLRKPWSCKMLQTGREQYVGADCFSASCPSLELHWGTFQSGHTTVFQEPAVKIPQAPLQFISVISYKTSLSCFPHPVFFYPGAHSRNPAQINLLMFWARSQPFRALLCFSSYFSSWETLCWWDWTAQWRCSGSQTRGSHSQLEA